MNLSLYLRHIIGTYNKVTPAVTKVSVINSYKVFFFNRRKRIGIKIKSINAYDSSWKQKKLFHRDLILEIFIFFYCRDLIYFGTCAESKYYDHKELNLRINNRGIWNCQFLIKHLSSELYVFSQNDTVQGEKDIFSLLSKNKTP